MKPLRRFVVSVMLLCLVFGLAVTDSSAKEGVTINVYNWGQYISDGTDGYLDVNAAFTAETGIQVNYMTFDSNETMYTKLKTGGSSYDIIIPSDYMIGRLIEEGMLQELNFDNIPNYQYVGESYKNTAYDPENRYSIPYTWGTVGIIYNKKYVAEEDLGSWDLLWNEKYSGKILMFDNPRDAFGAAELKLGYSLNESSDAALNACAELLKQQKPLVQDYVMDQVYSKMQHEEAWIAPYYAGDYLQMVTENEDLGFYFPKEGFNLYIDAICIPTSAQNKTAAEAYINFLCRPDISGQNLDYIGYSTPIEGATEYMDEEMAASSIAYPDESVLARGQNYLALSQETVQKMDSLWLGVKTDSGSNKVLIFGLIGVAVVVILLVLLLIRRRNKMKKRRSMYRQ